MVNLLFTVMQSLAQDWAEQSAVYFLLLARLLSYLSSSGVVLSNCSAVLTKQIDTLTMGREAVLRTGHTATPGSGRRADSGAGGGLDLPGLQALGGLQHLGPDPTQLHNHGRLASARYLVSTLIFLISQSFLAPLFLQTPAVVSAAFKLVVSLCTGCPGNLGQLGTMLEDMFYTRETEAVLSRSL